MKKVSIISLAAILSIFSIQTASAAANPPAKKGESYVSESRAGLEVTRIPAKNGEIILRLQLEQPEEVTGILTILGDDGVEMLKKRIEKANTELFIKAYTHEVRELNITFSNRNAQVSKQFYLHGSNMDVILVEVK